MGTTRACRTCGALFELQGRGAYWYCEAHRIERLAAKARDARNFRARHRATPASAKCVICGNPFIPQRVDAKTCSEDCRIIERRRRAQEAYEERKKGVCVDCGAQAGRRSSRCRLCANKAGGVARRGANSYLWKGGRRTDSKGYVYLLVHPEAPKGKRYQAEHIVVWERTNGKPLPHGWVVHHINGIKDDNRPENLEAHSRSKHNHFERLFEQLERRIAVLEERLNGNLHS